MTKPVSRLYVEAIRNNMFLRELEINDPEFTRPTAFTTETEKIMIACIYEGWLIANGEFDNSKYMD